MKCYYFRTIMHVNKVHVLFKTKKGAASFFSFEPKSLHLSHGYINFQNKLTLVSS